MPAVRPQCTTLWSPTPKVMMANTAVSMRGPLADQYWLMTSSETDKVGSSSGWCMALSVAAQPWVAADGPY